ncbi:MAG: DNA repair protein RecO [Propionibacteriaceae bacterium]|jgi:DNA repair protein RecO (recombination protein O)|nr:DNA repair protein RecO [Propionibacteriaceae bacterium]
MATYSDEGVVLRTHKLGEADRIVTILTRQHGKIRAVAKGVRRTSSRFGARLEPFSQCDLLIVEGRNLDIVSQAVSRRLLGRAWLDDYARYTAAEVMVETADRLVGEERQPALRQYLLLVGALRVLGHGTTDGPRPATMILDSYLLRALATAGYAPALEACANCGASAGLDFFSAQSGGLVCRRCRPPGSLSLTPTTLAYLGALLSGQWEDTRQVSEATARQASGLVTAFANWQLERGLRSLGHLDRG